MASNHIITIDIGEAVGNVRETVRAQLETLRFDEHQLVILVRHDDGDMVTHRDATDAERERIIDNIAKNVVQGLYALEVQS